MTTRKIVRGCCASGSHLKKSPFTVCSKNNWRKKIRERPSGRKKQQNDEDSKMRIRKYRTGYKSRLVRWIHPRSRKRKLMAVSKKLNAI